MSEPDTKTLRGEPGGLTTLLRAALPAVPGVNQLPGVRKAPARDFTGLTWSREGAVAERARVDAYAAVCGFPRKDVVPLTYPHMLAFPLHMAVMSDPAFPYPPSAWSTSRTRSPPIEPSPWARRWT